MKQANGFFKKVITIVKRPEMRILPGQLAFFLVISLVPLVALIGSIASHISIPLDTLKIVIGNSVPKEIGGLLTELIAGQGLNFNIIVFFVSAFILASNGPHSMIITSNEIYKIESSSILKRRAKAIMMTFILVILFFFLFLIPICGDSIFAILRIYSNNKILVDFFYQIFQILKYPFTIFILYYNIKLIYVIAPDKMIEKATTTRGAIFTTIGWIIATEIYSFYIETFSKYDLFYGSISNLLILLLWVYILSYIFVLGMVLNVGEIED